MKANYLAADYILGSSRNVINRIAFCRLQFSSCFCYRKSVSPFDRLHSGGAQPVQRLNKMFILRISALVAGMMLATVNFAQAATSTGTMAVSATVTTGCTVAATGLEFNSLALDENYAVSTVTVTCNGSIATPTLSIGVGTDGVGTDAGLNLRQMSSSDNRVPYTLSALKDGANIAADALTVLTPATPTSSFSAQLHGKITNSTDYQQGAYSDSVMLTITYTP